MKQEEGWKYREAVIFISKLIVTYNLGVKPSARDNR
jgi:hypothetical protein